MRLKDLDMNSQRIRKVTRVGSMYIVMQPQRLSTIPIARIATSTWTKMTTTVTTVRCAFRTMITIVYSSANALVVGISMLSGEHWYC